MDYGNGQKANLVLRNGTLSLDGSTLTVALDAGGVAAFGLVSGDGWPGPGHLSPGGLGGPEGHRGGFGGHGHR